MFWAGWVRRFCQSSAAWALQQDSVQAVPRVSFQAGCSLADLAARVGLRPIGGPAADHPPLPEQPLLVTHAHINGDVPGPGSRLWQQWGERVVPVEVSTCGGDYRDRFLLRPGRGFQAGVPVPLSVLLANIVDHTGGAGSVLANNADRATAVDSAADLPGTRAPAWAGPDAASDAGAADCVAETPGAHSLAGVGRAVPRLYLAQTDLSEALPELAERVPAEPPFREAAGRVYQRSLWLGPAGTFTPLHRDPYYNLLCQAWGAKRVRLFAPEHAAALLPHALPVLRNTSQAEVGDERLAGLPRWECEVRGGEALYIPRRWWHEVTARSASLSVSYWWT